MMTRSFENDARTRLRMPSRRKRHGKIYTEDGFAKKSARAELKLARLQTTPYAVPSCSVHKSCCVC